MNRQRIKDELLQLQNMACNISDIYMSSAYINKLISTRLIKATFAIKKPNFVVYCFLQVKFPHFCKIFSSPQGGEFLC